MQPLEVVVGAAVKLYHAEENIMITKLLLFATVYGSDRLVADDAAVFVLNTTLFCHRTFAPIPTSAAPLTLPVVE